ncbi:hypothetical protein [Rhizobium leguminosarum]|uniref:hypothetical protein n=1 Tax=Rhizobium leguminosarum TaxID=384 RepID=UPI0015BBF470
MAVQQQCRDGGSDVTIMKGDNCIDFTSQRFFCQLSAIRGRTTSISFRVSTASFQIDGRHADVLIMFCLVCESREAEAEVSVAFERKQSQEHFVDVAEINEVARKSCAFGANADQGARLYLELRMIWEQ